MRSIVPIFLALSLSVLATAEPFTAKLHRDRLFQGGLAVIPLSAIADLQSHITGVLIHQGEDDAFPPRDGVRDELGRTRWTRDFNSRRLTVLLYFDDFSIALLRFPDALPPDRIEELYRDSDRKLMADPKEPGLRSVVTVLRKPAALFTLLGDRLLKADPLEGIDPPGGILKATSLPSH